MLKRQGLWAGDATCAAPGGDRRLLDVRATALNDADGRLFAGLFTTRDVIRERSLEKQLIQSLQMDLVENLAGGIAHEYKNLLMIIMSYASLLKDQMASEEMKADLTRIEQAAHTANELTGRLTAVTRRTAAVMDEVDLKDVLADVSAMLKKSLPGTSRWSFPISRRSRKPGRTAPCSTASCSTSA